MGMLAAAGKEQRQRCVWRVPGATTPTALSTTTISGARAMAAAATGTEEATSRGVTLGGGPWVGADDIKDGERPEGASSLKARSCVCTGGEELDVSFSVLSFPAKL